MQLDTMLSVTEENYLKAIYKLSRGDDAAVSTNAIAALLDTSAASVTEMLKRLTEKGYTTYEKYKGVRLREEGEAIATKMLRRHRLWEVFMVDKLHFSWDEVHPIAEQLEHIQSDKLIDRLEEFLHFPKFDPHGDPIPDKEGNITYRQQVQLTALGSGRTGIIVGVADHSKAFLRHLEQLGLLLGTEVRLLEKFEYDGALKLQLNDEREQVISQKVGQNLYVKPQS